MMLNSQRGTPAPLIWSAALFLSVYAFVSSSYVPGVQARIIPPKLDEMIAASDLVVLGKVVAISRTGAVQIAEVAVQRVLKGEQSITRLYFRATPTWVCDVSRAEKNELGLYLLQRVRPDLETDMRRSPFYSLAVHGRGRFIKTGSDEFETRYEVIFPKSVPVVYRREGKYDRAAVVRLDSILRLISTINERASSSALSGDVRR